MSVSRPVDVAGASHGTLPSDDDRSYRSIDDDDFEYIHSADESVIVHEQSGNVGIPLTHITIVPSVAMPAALSSNPAQAVCAAGQTNSMTDAALKSFGSLHSRDGDDEGSKTPIMHRSIEIASDGAANNHETPLLERSVINSVGTDIRDSLTIYSSASDKSEFIDPILAIESIRSDYKAAQGTMRTENDALLKMCETKSEEVNGLRRRLKEAEDEKMRMHGELNKKESSLNDLRMAVDQLTAEKIQCDDVIRILEKSIRNSNCDGNGSVQPPHYLDHVSSLQAKDAKIKELTDQLNAMKQMYEKERAKGLDLEEIVKVLLEQNNESEQMLRHAQQEYQIRLRQVEEQAAALVSRGEVNNV